MRGPRETSCEYIFELCTEHHPVSRLQRKDLRYTGQSIDFLYLQRQKVRAFCEIRWYHGTWLPSYKKDVVRRFPSSKAVRACTKRLLNLEIVKHEKAAIYEVNQRISNVCRIVRAAKLQNNPGHQVMVKSFLTMTSF